MYELIIYICHITGSVEDLVATEQETFDAVIASEVVEHVPDLFTFIKACCDLVKVNSNLIIIHTYNKNQKPQDWITILKS